MANKPNNEFMNDFVNAIGAVAEMTLIFYRNAINAGATEDESFKLTQAFIAATVFGNNGHQKSDNT